MPPAPDRTHYWLMNGVLPICGLSSGYATTDARDVTCLRCRALIFMRWRRSPKRKAQPSRRKRAA